MGAGKSTVGEKLSHLLRLQFIDSDQVLESKHNSTVEDIFRKYQEPYFRVQEQLIIHELTQRKNIILATGGGSILSESTRSVLARAGLVCYLRVSPLQQVKRALTAGHRPTLPCNSSERLCFFQKMHSERAHLYESIAHLSIDTDCIDADVTTTRIFENIKDCV
jgi:shikimate kinase